jgi:hypothetical protein
VTSVDQLTREDIAAATAVHAELGPGYDQAVAESLVDRIGAEIDRRVDARLAQGTPSGPSAPARPAWVTPVMGLGSLGLGIGATAAVLTAATSAGADTLNAGTGVVTRGSVIHTISAGQILLVMLIWVVIGVVNVAYARHSGGRS